MTIKKIQGDTTETILGEEERRFVLDLIIFFEGTRNGS